MPSILIIDSQLLVRHGLRQVLDQEYRGVVFGEAADTSAALAQLAKRAWDLLILDVAGEDSFRLLAEIRKRDPLARVLLFTDAGSQHILRAQSNGASGCVSRSAGRPDLLRAINAVLAGQKYFAGVCVPDPNTSVTERHHLLSPREYRVMLALASGKRVSAVAAELDLSAKTVSTYKFRVLNKMRLDSVADLVRYMIDHGLTPQDPEQSYETSAS